jgi:hypothetical protein
LNALRDTNECPAFCSPNVTVFFLAHNQWTQFLSKFTNRKKTQTCKVRISFLVLSDQSDGLDVGCIDRGQLQAEENKTIMSTFQVESEIYTETNFLSVKNAENDSLVSKFQFEYPDGDCVNTDKDGDYVVPRKIKDFVEIGSL